MKVAHSLEKIVLLCLMFNLPIAAFGQDADLSSRDGVMVSETLTPAVTKKSWFALGENAVDYGPRSVYWRPLVSILLPGFDQYLSGHTASGLAYTSVAVGSSVWAADRQKEWDKERETREYRLLSKEDKEDYQLHNEPGRQLFVAQQITQDIGFLSAYHSFRTSVVTHQKEGRYKFLTKEETPAQLLAAPFDFTHLSKFTTLAPLAIVGALAAIEVNDPGSLRKRRHMTSSDAAFTGLISYNAGVSEEAVFRGYIHPLLYESWQSPFWANFAQAALFAAAHLGSTDGPYVQAGFGYYMGWLSERREWTLSESIFIHTWWDVIAVSSTYLTERRTNKNAVLWLPAYKLAW